MIQCLKYKKQTVNLLYLLIWIIPFYLFFKDFFHLSDFLKVFNERTFRIIYHTFFQALISTVFAFLISLFPAYYISKKNNALSQWLASSVFIPYYFPVISTIVSFSIIFSWSKINILYTLAAIVIAHVFYNSPIFVKFMGEALKKFPHSIREAALVDGASRRSIFFFIELPCIASSILKAFFIVFTYTFTSFGVILSLGNIKYSSLEVIIAMTLNSQLDFSKALSYALIQYIILSGINLLFQKIEVEELESEKQIQHEVTPSVQFFSLIYLVFEYSIVFIGVGASFFQFSNLKFDLTGFINLFDPVFNQEYPVLLSLFNTTVLSALTSFVVTIFVYFLLKNKNKYSDLIIISTLGISSAFLSITLYYQNVLFNIPCSILLFIGYFLIVIPVSYSFLYQHIVGFNQEIIELGKIDGADQLTLFRYIELPILLPVFLSNFIQIFAIVFGEFTIGYTMQIQDIFPVASVINYSLAARRLLRESAAMSGLNIIIILFLFLISKKMISKESPYQKRRPSGNKSFSWRAGA